MERDLGSIGVLSLTAVGAVAVAVGLWLPWLVVKPTHAGAVPSITHTGTGYGFSGFDYPVLLLVAVGALLSARYGTTRSRARLSILTAAVPVLTVLWYVARTVGVDGTYLDVFVVGRGISVTLFGGGVLLVAGVLRYAIVGTDERSRTTDPNLD